MAGIFGIALRGLGMLGKGKKVSKTINSVKPNVPKTKLEKAKSKLAIAKQKTNKTSADPKQTSIAVTHSLLALLSLPPSLAAISLLLSHIFYFHDFSGLFNIID